MNHTLNLDDNCGSVDTLLTCRHPHCKCLKFGELNPTNTCFTQSSDCTVVTTTQGTTENIQSDCGTCLSYTVRIKISLLIFDLKWNCHFLWALLSLSFLLLQHAYTHKPRAHTEKIKAIVDISLRAKLMFLAYKAIMEIGMENFNKPPPAATSSYSNLSNLLKTNLIKNNLEHFWTCWEYLRVWLQHV